MSSNRNRRLTSSVSTSNIGELGKNVNALTSSAYNTMGQRVVDNRTAGRNTETGEATTPQAGTTDALGVDSKQPSSELAKIQPTSALSIDHDLLIQKKEGQPRTELVTKFVDFSSKYGLGYMLSNGSYGVLFNDSTKIILHPNLFHFDYIAVGIVFGEV